MPVRDDTAGGSAKVTELPMPNTFLFLNNCLAKLFFTTDKTAAQISLWIPLEAAHKFSVPWFSGFLLSRIIHSASSISRLFPSFGKPATLSDSLLACSILPGLLHAHGSLRDAQQKHHAAPMGRPRHTWIIRVKIHYHLCSCHPIRTWTR